ncbi:hypothetical protein [Variovorax boronicumulans]|uniref:hypothetical protein n=1 Tax=Variovorax boronicumulans TaxID=436515 RepID=UPI001C56AB38
MSFKRSSLGRSAYSIVQTFGARLYRRSIISAEKLTADQAEDYLLSNAKKELLQAKKSILFYDGQGYSKAALSTSLSDFLKCLPVINKATLKNKDGSFFPKNWKKGKTSHTTSGSSGSPLTIFSSIKERFYGEALLCRQIEKVTQKWGVRNCLILSGFYVNDSHDEERFFTRDWINNNIYISIYHLTPANVGKYIAALQKFKPEIIYGYASSLHTVAQMLAAVNYVASDVKMIISTSEILQQNWRTLIGQSFGAPVHNLYGSQEGCHFAFECANGVMHIHPARGVIEVQNSEGLHRDGRGVAVVTPIKRPSFPVFRYSLEDVVKISSPKKCACGLNTYQIDEIDGRSEDLVVSRDGRKVGYLNFHATKDVKGLLESQLVQKNWEDFDFLYVPSIVDEAKLLELEGKIKSELSRRLGMPIKVDFLRVERIPRNARGKFKAVVVDRKFLETCSPI